MAKRSPTRLKKKRKKQRKKKRPSRSFKVALAVISLAAIVAVSGLALLSQGVSLIEVFVGKESHRMADFQDEPQAFQADLLYLTYLDSLFHSDLHDMPTDHYLSLHEQTNIAQIVMDRSGVSRSTMFTWGVAPRQKSEWYTNSELMRHLNEKGRYILPGDSMPLLFHIKQKKLRRGHLIFGRRLDRDESEGVSFLAVISHVDLIVPMLTTVIYLDDRSDRPLSVGKRVHITHGRLRDCPKFLYYGGGIPGDDLSGVFDRYLRKSKLMPW